MDDRKSKSIDEFISGFPPDVQEILQELRRVIRKVAPEAVETISYGIPTFKLKGRNLVHFSAFKNHIGFYPTSSPMGLFEKDLSGYEVSKGTIRFPLDKPIPFALVKRIVAFRVKEVSGKDKPKQDPVAKTHVKDNAAGRSWFLAGVVERSEDPGKPQVNPNRRSLTWVNTLLISARSLSEAYDKAMRIAKKRYPQQYQAIAGNTVRWSVLGLSSLEAVFEDLKDGSEISWTSMGEISAKRAESMVQNKRQLVPGTGATRRVVS